MAVTAEGGSVLPLQGPRFGRRVNNLQVENTIVAYSQSARSLTALERDYRARRRGAETLTLRVLVARQEGVLTTELAGWVQR